MSWKAPSSPASEAPWKSKIFLPSIVLKRLGVQRGSVSTTGGSPRGFSFVVLYTVRQIRESERILKFQDFCVFQIPWPGPGSDDALCTVRVRYWTGLFCPFDVAGALPPFPDYIAGSLACQGGHTTCSYPLKHTHMSTSNMPGQRDYFRQRGETQSDIGSIADCTFVRTSSLTHLLGFLAKLQHP
jgi:hypothetical protein